MPADDYLYSILRREAVGTGVHSPAQKVLQAVHPHLQDWAGGLIIGVTPSGSFAKGTANSSGTDIDLFISLSEKTNGTLKEIYESLYKKMAERGFSPNRQNVSIHVKVAGYDVDLVPARRQGSYGDDHSLFRRRAGTWTKTNVVEHIRVVRAAGRQDEIRILKLWRYQKGLDFPSFYLELTAIAALQGKAGALSYNVLEAIRYFRDSFTGARIIDPANTNNIISDDLTAAERGRIQAAADTACRAENWGQIVS